ncbi:hypothetical protein ACNG5D_08145 [Algibacter sp. PT7-4]
MQSYAQSKLALTMWSFHFAKQHKEIISIAINLGSLLNTKMANEAYGQHWSPAEKGVNVIHDLTMSERHINQSGTYFDNDKAMYANAHPDAYDDNTVKLLLTLIKTIISDKNFN